MNDLQIKSIESESWKDKELVAKQYNMRVHP